MKQRFEAYSHELAWKAADAMLEGKWQRRDVLDFVEKYSGIPRKEIFEGVLNNDVHAKMEAVEAIATLGDEMIDCIEQGIPMDYLDEVVIEKRPDGMTGKIRDIANLSLPHQLLGHIAKLMLEPLFLARIMPWQHASMPGRGQTMLKNQIGKKLRSNSLDIKVFVKTDIHHAYGTLMYKDCIRFIRKEIPSCDLIFKLLRYLERFAPDGHLIIGGYLDAWLFNYMMSYGIRYVLKQGRVRRGEFHPHIVAVETYMDDFVFMGKSKTGLRQAVKILARWLKENLNMELRMTTGFIKLCSVDEERERKKTVRPAIRGCPNIDMGGYQIHRTYVTIRPRVHKRCKRAFDRAFDELCETGTIQIQRARNIIARYGPVVHSTSLNFLFKHHVLDVMKVAKAVCRYHARAHSRRKKIWLNATVERHKVLLDKVAEEGFSNKENGGNKHVRNHKNKIQTA